jgi:hypothetical protein
MAALIPNIIHNKDRHDRRDTLLAELKYQGIEEFRVWDAIYDRRGAHIGINKAHKQIVEYAKQEGLPEVLIFEDDIRFCGKGAFDYYIANKPEDFDIYLGGIYFGKIDDNNQVERFAALHCYIVNSKFYDTFLRVSGEEHLDGALTGLGKYIVCNPFAAVQYNGYSENNKHYCNFDSLLENRNLLAPIDKIGVKNMVA